MQKTDKFKSFTTFPNENILFCKFDELHEKTVKCLLILFFEYFFGLRFRRLFIYLILGGREGFSKKLLFSSASWGVDSPLKKLVVNEQNYTVPFFGSILDICIFPYA